MFQRQLKDDVPLDEPEQVMWIGSDTAPFPKREKILAKAELPMSAFKSGTQRMEDDSDEGSPGPGPGQYDDLGFTDQLKLQMAKRPGIPKGHFGGVAGKNGFRKTFAMAGNADPYLGPGWYEPDTRPASASSKASYPAFGIQEGRSSAIADSDTPGPGKYHVSSATKSEERSVTPRPTTPQAHFGPTYSPKPDPDQSRAMALAALQQGRLDASARKALLAARRSPAPDDNLTPGPGEYSLPTDRELLRNSPEDEAFMTTEPRYPTPKTYRMVNPGPGRYSPEPVSTSPVFFDFGVVTGRFAETPEIEASPPMLDLAMYGKRAG